AVDAAGSGLFATLGAMHSFSQSGELMPDAAAKAGLQVKPSETALQLIKAFEPYAGDIVAAAQKFKEFKEATSKEFKDLDLDAMFRARFFTEAGGSKEALQRWYDLVKKAAGREEPKVEEPVKVEPADHYERVSGYLKELGLTNADERNQKKPFEWEG